MPYEIGGRADKSGNRYEFRWVVYQILRILEEKINAILLEAVGNDEKGIDVWVRKNDGTKEGQQCKGRNGSKETWDYPSIRDKNIIKTWKYQLDSDEFKTVSLVSPLSFTLLEDLIDRSNNNNGNASDFYSGQILTSGKEFQKFFNNFSNEMNLDKEKEVDLVKLVTYLRRISYHQYPDSTLKELIFDKIRYLLIGDEIEIYNSLVSWVADGNILGKEINYIKVKEFLDNNNIQLRNLTLDKRIQPQIDELNDEYEQRFPMIRNNLIIRKEFFECRKMIELGESSVIYGKAGRGKSGCTIDLVNYCKSKKIPYLAIKLDNHVPSRNAEEWAKEIGLPGSIPDCIDSISMNQRAVIILDQLDALRWTQNHSRESIVVCE